MADPAAFLRQPARQYNRLSWDSDVTAQ